MACACSSGADGRKFRGLRGGSALLACRLRTRRSAQLPSEVGSHLPQSAATAEHDLLQRSVTELTRLTGCSVAFGGLTTPDGTPLTAFTGAHAHSLDGVLIEPARGCGGLAAVDRKPVAATNYRESSAITHDYDREVTAEGIVSLIAVPVVVDGRVRAILYGGHRTATQFGEG